jgi:hypothetical protein
MTDRRELEGIGYYYFDYDGDCLLIDQWTKRPDDLTVPSFAQPEALSDVRGC